MMAIGDKMVVVFLLVMLFQSSSSIHIQSSSSIWISKNIQEVSVELIGGSIPSEGNVYAINSDNNLGPVCDDAWEDRDARVVCRQLGYADGIATSGSKFGSVPNNFAMDDVNCNGGEARIQDCSYEIQDNCGTGEGAGVNCSNPIIVPVQLIGSSIPSEGNVYAINSENKFGPVCDDNWQDIYARVVCRQMGYADGIATKQSKFGFVPRNFSMDDVNCNGVEARIQDCSYKTQYDCGPGEGAGVICTSSNSLVSVKLIGGSIPSEGNVYAINSDNKLGPVCDDNWQDRNARVVCRQMGYADGNAIIGSGFGMVPHNFSMDDVNCNGGEARIQDCSYNIQDNCGTGEGAGVNCSNPFIVPGSIPSEGNVYAINSNNMLGPVCDDAWEDRDARIVCRQLGYADGIATSGSKFGNVPNNFAMDDVNCNGGEARVQDCSYSIQHNCGTGEGAGVNCTNPIVPAINGGWSNFSPFSQCSATCGTGIKEKTRTCTNPPPRYGGQQCKGVSKETESCVLVENCISIKLIGGSIPSEGNVYAVNSDDKLGPVCDDAWDDRDASVVCRQLGYADGIATSGSKFGNVSISNNYAMDDVNCNGSEARIQDCSYNIQHNCGTREGAGVKCINLNDSVCGRSETIIRRSVYDLSSENVTAYNNALKTIKSYSYENPKSFPNIGSYHGAPWMCNWNQTGPPTRNFHKNTDTAGHLTSEYDYYLSILNGVHTGCCVNHWYEPTSILLFNPWHRLYTYQMEQSLYEASGLSMPYWDWTTPNPYYGIYQPNKLPYLAKQKEWLNGPIKGSYNHLSGVQNLTTRGPKANINYRRLKGMVRTAYNQRTFHDFNYQIVHPHNLIHLHVGSCPADYWEANYKNQAKNCNQYSFGNGSGEYIPLQAGHMASNYWASYDPIFYLHHSFVDYQYAFYQELHKLDPSTYKMNYKKEDVKMQPYDRSTNPHPASKQHSTGKQGERYKDVFCYEYDHLLFDGLTPQQFIENEKERRKFFRIYAGISLKRTGITSNIAFEMLHNDSSKYVGSLATLGVPNKKPNYSQSLLNKRVVLYDVTDELQDPLGAQTANVKFNVTRYTDGETENMDLPLQETYKPIVIYQEPSSDDQIFQLHVEDAHEYAPIMYGKIGHKVEFMKNGLSLSEDNDVTAYVGGYNEDIEKPINGRYPIEYQEHTFLIRNDAGQINITIGYDLDDIECEDGHPYPSDPDTKVIPWNIDWLKEHPIFNVTNCPSTSVIIASCTDSLSTVKKTTQQDYEDCTNLWSKGNDGIMGLLVDTKNTGTVYYASGKKISNTENFCDIGGKIAINVLEC